MNKNNSIAIITLSLLLCSPHVLALQPLGSATSQLTALTHAKLMLSPGKQLDDATLLIENNRIKAIIDNDDIPAAALIINLEGYTIYPGFIDPFTDYGITFEYPKTEKSPPTYDISRIGGNAENGAIHAEKEWVSYIQANKEQSKDWVNNGFTSVQTSKLDGIFRGQATSISLADAIPNQVIYQARAAQFMAFDKGSSPQDYPNSLMGSMALIRQTLSDARWYNENKSKSGTVEAPNNIEFNIALEKLSQFDKQQIIFDTDNLNNQLRAARLLAENNLNGIFLGSGHEYARIDEIKALKYKIILPLIIPEAPDVSDEDKAREVTLAQLRHWERAPSTPKVLAEAKVPFAFTQHGIDAKDFWPRLQRAVKQGLDEDTALAALTTEAADMAGISDIAGKLAAGAMADLVIAKGNLFTDGKIYSVWLQGKEQVLKDRALNQLIGQYQLQFGQMQFDLDIDEKTDDKSTLNATLSSGEQSIDVNNMVFEHDRLTFNADLTQAGVNGISRFTLWLDDSGLHGRMIDEQGHVIPVASATSGSNSEVDPQESDVPAAEDKVQGQADTSVLSQLTRPNVAYGLKSSVNTEKLHIKNATVWTSEDDGILQATDVLVANGKIERIGQQLATPANYTVIDGTNKHLTAGIIDEHSHIALNGGINEASYAVTSEVRIGDVINPDDIAIYRALAGGVTSAQILHGSANPIGGQSQYIKMRWGENADGLKFTQAPASIKFALGENVKQSHWGDKFVERFPQSRMGVETLFSQSFDAAIAYEKAQADYDDLRSSDKRKTTAVRTDYRLEALKQVLHQQRDIHIHSYVQSEILMFLRLASAYNFKVQTFTHVLEGYKVANELAAHGAGASTFADWWAYKFEVYDAIPQNTCLMMNKGVLTSINSDDYEMQRRLNQEAAKSMLYCDMSAENAWKMVTINPAKQLGVDNWVGSIKQGKMADLVLWSANPLSVYAKAEKVWIEGGRYFDRAQDSKAQAAVATERQALIQKILASDKAATSGDKPTKTTEPQWHCDTQFNAWGHTLQGAR